MVSFCCDLAQVGYRFVHMDAENQCSVPDDLSLIFVALDNLQVEDGNGVMVYVIM